MYGRIAQLKTVETFRGRLAALGLELPVDDRPLSSEEGSPLAAPGNIGGLVVGNRWCIHPMEGWDAETDGSPSPLTIRRWQRFGSSGAKLIWGGEAAAVQHDGRANPKQLMAAPQHRAALAALLQSLRASHREAFGTTDDLVVGLQLTHSGRFSRPNTSRLEPRIAYHHPLLDAKFGIAADDQSVTWTDDALKRLADTFVSAAQLAYDVGFQFVDIKACHGYLLHELLGAFMRPGPFGGDFAGRTRFLCSVIERVRAECPQLRVGVRLSAFDSVPYRHGATVGEPAPFAGHLPYRYGFGVSADDPRQPDLSETIALLKKLQQLGVAAVNLSCGSPYYNPHLQRPALFPPSDGYPPPEDPLVGAVRQITLARQCKQAVPELPMVGTGYSYLQEFLPHVAQAVVRAGWIDYVGVGRMVLSYPELPHDVLAGKPLDRKHICRTFSDCTTAPRNGLESGCYPLDAHYKALPQAAALDAAKQRAKDADRESVLRAGEGAD